VLVGLLVPAGGALALLRFVLHKKVIKPETSSRLADHDSTRLGALLLGREATIIFFTLRSAPHRVAPRHRPLSRLVDDRRRAGGIAAIGTVSPPMTPARTFTAGTGC
jgi:hypothetical protein